MKKYNSLFLLFPLFLLFACSTKKAITQTLPEQNSVDLIGVFDKCNEVVGLFEFDGIGFKKIKELPNAKQDTFRFEVPASPSRFYYVGTKSGRKRPVILGTEASVFVSGNCQNLRQAKFKASPVNTGYDDLLQVFNNWNRAMRNAGRSLQSAGHDQQKMKEVIDEMAKIDQEKLAKIEAMKQSNPYLAKVAVLNAYLSFQNNNKGRFNNEVEYFGKTYFDLADFSDSDYNHIPYLFESFKNWSKVLSQQRIPENLLQGLLDSTLARIPAKKRAMKYALGGIVTSLQSGNHPLFEPYGKRYVALFEDQNQAAIIALKKKIDLAGSFVTGAVAPDFTQKTPEGNPMSLSDLRGKVVLVDFWASWCGPCRRENPNVIKVYEKYKDKGFDILGVSLDRKKEPWLKAIEKDKLPWHHISDLKGWKNEVALLYSVSSIPHTILLDREGRILARNLRGAELEAALKKIFKD